MFRRVARRWLRLRADRRGAMSVEFAIVMPLMLFALAGGVGYYSTFRAYTDLTKISYVVNDMMSRYESVSNTDLADLMNIQNRLMPDKIRERQLRITSICFANGAYKVLWSWSSHTTDTTALPALVDADIPLDLLPDLDSLSEQDSIILTEVVGE